MTAIDTAPDALGTAELAALTAPSIVTELPGPAARAVIDRDEARHQPVAHPRLPARGEARRRAS